MLAKLTTHSRLPQGKNLQKMKHLLVVLPPGVLPEDCPQRPLLEAALHRRGKPAGSLASVPLPATTAEGALCVWCMLDPAKPVFEQQGLLRKALQSLFDERPERVDVLLSGDAAFNAVAASLATYVALANGAPLPTARRKDAPRALKELVIWNGQPEAAAVAQAEANWLARSLIVQPPNQLTPTAYRRKLADLASKEGWQHEEFGIDKLRKLGAGAFLAVAQGSAVADAAIVHLSYRPKRASARVALVGKGICFDTGGHNLKSAKYMAGMHEDMAGSAVAVALLLAATRLNLPLRIDCWLALANNEISPLAYRQGDVVTALDGTTIEIVHTDAEGRMVLADTLALAARKSPDVLVDFATLTGSMITALGNRYGGVFASAAALAGQAVAAGEASGERVCVFPMDADYEEELESSVADIKQCTLAGEADHILAARFLRRFVGEIPWLHVDLSAASCKGGLGAIGSEQTGFGVGWGVKFLTQWMRQSPLLPQDAGIN